MAEQSRAPLGAPSPWVCAEAAEGLQGRKHKPFPFPALDTGTRSPGWDFLMGV